MTASNDSRQKFNAIAAVVAVLLLGIIAFLLYNKASQDQTIESLQLEGLEAEKAQEELNEQYFALTAELEQQKTNNEELNGLIDSQKEELKSQKNKISRMIRSGKSSKKELEEVRMQIQSMAGQRDQYLAEINNLKAQNEQLAASNQVLTSERNTLQEEVAVERTNVENLNSEKAVLVSKKEVLEEEKEVLTGKVNYGSVLRVKDVTATGWKIKKNGDSVKKTYAKNIDQMKVCFNTTVNDLASTSETFYARVINPLGETMAVEGLGSGVFTNDSNEQVRYTKSKEIPYNQEAKFQCINWAPGTPFLRGDYEIQVYNKGYLAGKGKCSLK